MADEMGDRTEELDGEGRPVLGAREGKVRRFVGDAGDAERLSAANEAARAVPLPELPYRRVHDDEVRGWIVEQRRTLTELKRLRLPKPSKIFVPPELLRKLAACGAVGLDEVFFQGIPVVANDPLPPDHPEQIADGEDDPTRLAYWLSPDPPTPSHLEPRDGGQVLTAKRGGLGESGMVTENCPVVLKLRDHFAGLAMQGLVREQGRGQSSEDIAYNAYDMADAMLRERRVDRSQDRF